MRAQSAFSGEFSKALSQRRTAPTLSTAKSRAAAPAAAVRSRRCADYVYNCTTPHVAEAPVPSRHGDRDDIPDAYKSSEVALPDPISGANNVQPALQPFERQRVSPTAVRTRPPQVPQETRDIRWAAPLLWGWGVFVCRGSRGSGTDSPVERLPFFVRVASA